MNILIHSHSILRYFILAALAFVVVKALLGWLSNKPFSRLDDKAGLYLLIFTHLQFLAGIVLYFTSDTVQFTASTMKDATLRYWAVEHGVSMLLAVVLITIARISSKKLEGTARHKRLFIFNVIALVLILSTLYMSGRGILVPNP